MYPTHHGLTANEWWDKVGDRWTEVGAGDRLRRRAMLAREDAVGESPWRMEATSIGDWFKAASPAAKVIAIGSDAAIPYGGKRPDGTYWFDSGSGRLHHLDLLCRGADPPGSTRSTRGSRSFRKTWTAAPFRERWRALANHPQQCPAFKSDGDAP